MGDGNLCTCSSVNSEIGAGPSGGRVGPLLVSSTVARLALVLGFVVLFVPLRVRLLLRVPGGGEGGPDIFESEHDVKQSLSVLTPFVLRVRAASFQLDLTSQDYLVRQRIRRWTAVILSGEKGFFF